MTAPLDEKAIEIALGCYSEGGCAGLDERERREVVTDIISAYLAASPSPSMEMEVVATFQDWWNSDGRFLDPDTSDVPWFDKREALAEYAYDAALSQAQSALAAMRAQKEEAEDAENQAKDCFWAIYPRYLELGGEPVSTEAARTDLSAQVLRLTEENEALRKERTSLIETKRAQIERLEGELDLVGRQMRDIAKSNAANFERAEAAEARLALKENAR